MTDQIVEVTHMSRERDYDGFRHFSTDYPAPVFTYLPCPRGISLRTACIRDYQATIWELSDPLQIHVLPDGSMVALYGVALSHSFKMTAVSMPCEHHMSWRSVCGKYIANRKES